MAAPTIRHMEAPFSMMALQLQATHVYSAERASAASAAPPDASPASPAGPAGSAAPAALAAPTVPTVPAAPVAPTAPAAPAAPAVAPPLSLDSSRDEDEDVSDLLRLDHVTGRVEIEMPFCGREPSYNSESLRRQISFLFDEPSPKPGLPARNDPVLQDAAWALNWAGTSRAATAA